MKKTLIYLGIAAATTACLTACKNGEQEFPDYEGGTTVYFATQYPVRTITLGNMEQDNSLDNKHMCAIYATMGGAYNGRNITLDIAVDNSLCDNLYFLDDAKEIAGPVLPMPANYYTLASNQIKYNEMSNMMGRVDVQLTDAFFADPKSIETTYVIPVVIKHQTGAGWILTGTVKEPGTNPARTDAEAWEVQPMDYVLYCVRYINPWDADYIRRGKDVLTYNGNTETRHRRNDDFGGDLNAGDEICAIDTRSMTQAVFPVSVRFGGGEASKTCNLLLTFNNNECTIASDTEGVEATGTGKFVSKGAPQAWGCKDRDVLYLSYNIDFGSQQVATTDTLVVRSRRVNKKVTFTPKYVIQ